MDILLGMMPHHATVFGFGASMMAGLIQDGKLGWLPPQQEIIVNRVYETSISVIYPEPPVTVVVANATKTSPIPPEIIPDLRCDDCVATTFSTDLLLFVGLLLLALIYFLRRRYTLAGAAADDGDNDDNGNQEHLVALEKDLQHEKSYSRVLGRHLQNDQVYIATLEGYAGLLETERQAEMHYFEAQRDEARARLELLENRADEDQALIDSLVDQVANDQIQIDDLRAQRDEDQARISWLRAQRGMRDDSVHYLEYRNDSLQEELTNHQDTIKAIAAQRDKAEGNTIACQREVQEQKAAAELQIKLRIEAESKYDRSEHNLARTRSQETRGRNQIRNLQNNVADLQQAAESLRASLERSQNEAAEFNAERERGRSRVRGLEAEVQRLSSRPVSVTTEAPTIPDNSEAVFHDIDTAIPSTELDNNIEIDFETQVETIAPEPTALSAPADSPESFEEIPATTSTGEELTSPTSTSLTRQAVEPDSASSHTASSPNIIKDNDNNTLQTPVNAASGNPTNRFFVDYRDERGNPHGQWLFSDIPPRVVRHRARRQGLMLADFLAPENGATYRYHGGHAILANIPDRELPKISDIDASEPSVDGAAGVSPVICDGTTQGADVGASRTSPQIPSVEPAQTPPNGGSQTHQPSPFNPEASTWLPPSSVPSAADPINTPSNELKQLNPGAPSFCPPFTPPPSAGPAGPARWVVLVDKATGLCVPSDVRHYIVRRQATNAGSTIRDFINYHSGASYRQHDGLWVLANIPKPAGPLNPERNGMWYQGNRRGAQSLSQQNAKDAEEEDRWLRGGVRIDYTWHHRGGLQLKRTQRFTSLPLCPPPTPVRRRASWEIAQADVLQYAPATWDNVPKKRRPQRGMTAIQKYRKYGENAVLTEHQWQTVRTAMKLKGQDAGPQKAQSPSPLDFGRRKSRVSLPPANAYGHFAELPAHCTGAVALLEPAPVLFQHVEQQQPAQLRSPGSQSALQFPMREDGAAVAQQPAPSPVVVKLPLSSREGMATHERNLLEILLSPRSSAPAQQAVQQPTRQPEEIASDRSPSDHAHDPFETAENAEIETPQPVVVTSDNSPTNAGMQLSMHDVPERTALPAREPIPPPTATPSERKPRIGGSGLLASIHAAPQGTPPSVPPAAVVDEQAPQQAESVPEQQQQPVLPPIPTNGGILASRHAVPEAPSVSAQTAPPAQQAVRQMSQPRQPRGGARAPAMPGRGKQSGLSDSIWAKKP